MSELLNKVTQGDCLEVMRGIHSGSVDLILCDPPYGNMKGANLDGWSHSTTEWDTIIDTCSLFSEYVRILRENGTLVLFSQEPYTSHLRTYQEPNLEFIYPLFWRKDHFANALLAKKAPVSLVEDISVFTKKYDSENNNQLRTYFKDVLLFIGESKATVISEIGQKADHTFRTESLQFKVCTRETYEALDDVYKISSMPGYLPYEELERINGRFKKRFNLPNGAKYKPNVLEYRKDYGGLHPTQKPVALMEDIIRTYTNEGETVLDNCLGSGTTAVAAINTGRNFIGIEQLPEYVEIANKRIEEALAQRDSKEEALV